LVKSVTYGGNADLVYQDLLLLLVELLGR